MRMLAACLLFALLSLAACQQQKEPPASTIFGTTKEVGDDQQVYDLPSIRDAGVLIGITLSGPDTYYEYRGEGFGLQYRLAKEFASSIGTTLQMEIAPDTAALLERLENQQADFVCMELHPGEPWLTRSNTPLLREAIAKWWNPSRSKELQKQTKTHVTRRKSRPAMQDRARGIISPYDDLLIRYSSTVGWDWRLLAAQCYQESAFDPKAQSWAGAQGLMQLMPATAELMGVPKGKVFDPEANIAAGTRYLKHLTGLFRDIKDPSDRIAFVLAAYNGGSHHVRDAMALTAKYGKDEHRWRNVAPYVLRLAEPAFYRDPVVKYGYLRGSETEAYVRLILGRWQDYCGVARAVSAASQPAPSRRSVKDGSFRSKVKSAEEWVPETPTENAASEDKEGKEEGINIKNVKD